MECPSVQFVLEREQFSPNVFLFSTELRGFSWLLCRVMYSRLPRTHVCNSVRQNLFLNMTDNPNELPQNEVLWQTICYIYIYIFYSYDKTIPVSAIPLKPKQSPITFKIRDWMRNDWEQWNELDCTWNATCYTKSNPNIRNGMCLNKASSHDWNKKTLDSINLKAEMLFFSWQGHPCSRRN